MRQGKAVNRRLVHYKNVLHKLRGFGLRRVYSNNLAETLGISASLVRKDFATFNLLGNRRGGYQIGDLLDSLNLLLGNDQEHTVIIVGAGKLGRAISEYEGFLAENITIAALFAADTARLAPEAIPPILPMTELEHFVDTQDIRIAVIAVPPEMAQRVADRLVLAGIRGFLNLAPIRLILPTGCVENRVNLALELEKLIYEVNSLGQDLKGDD